MAGLNFGSYKEAAAVAYIVLSLLGYMASTIFYAQVGLWYPSLAGLTDYFLAAIQDLYGLVGLVALAVVSLLYYGLGSLIGYLKTINDRRMRRAETDPTVRARYFSKLAPRIDSQVLLFKDAWKWILWVGVFFIYILFPYMQGRALADSPETYVHGALGGALTIKTADGERAVKLIGTTSEYAIVVDETQPEVVVYRRDDISLIRRSIR